MCKILVQNACLLELIDGIRIISLSGIIFSLSFELLPIMVSIKLPKELRVSYAPTLENTICIGSVTGYLIALIAIYKIYQFLLLSIVLVILAAVLTFFWLLLLVHTLVSTEYKPTLWVVVFCMHFTARILYFGFSIYAIQCFISLYKQKKRCRRSNEDNCTALSNVNSRVDIVDPISSTNAPSESDQAYPAEPTDPENSAESADPKEAANPGTLIA